MFLLSFKLYDIYISHYVKPPRLSLAHFSILTSLFFRYFLFFICLFQSLSSYFLMDSFYRVVISKDEVIGTAFCSIPPTEQYFSSESFMALSTASELMFSPLTMYFRWIFVKTLGGGSSLLSAVASTE